MTAPRSYSNLRAILLLAGVLSCSLLARHVAGQMFANATGSFVEEERPTVQILVAKVDIQFGQKFDEPEKFFSLKQVQAGEEPNGAFRSLEEVKGKRTNKSIAVGTPFTMTDVMGDAWLGGSSLPRPRPPFGVLVPGKTAAALMADDRIDVV